MKLGKHVEGAESGKCSDRISSLPDELLAQILSFLPTSCAVSTSILSKRWRYLFTLTNCLYFDDAPCHDGPIVVGETIEAAAARESRFQNFVNNVLELHQVSPIEKFCLVCRGGSDGSHLNAWISFAVQKGVQDLHCEVGRQQDVLPDSVFMSQRLVRLKMTGNFHEKYHLKIPLSVWLPSLKVLHLDHVTFSNGDSIERMFAGCKMLEELTLEWCDCDNHYQVIVSTGLLKILAIRNCYFDDGLFEIDAPNLACLSYKDNTCMKVVLSQKDSFTLAKADLSACYLKYDTSYMFDKHQYNSELIKAAADKVTELHLTTYIIERLLEKLGLKEMPVFRSLSRIQICDWPYFVKSWKSVTSLLDKSPQLETVVFGQCSSGQVCLRDVEVTPFNEDLTPFSCHAQVIEVHDFDGSECALVCLGHLLRNAKVLKRLILHCRYVAVKWPINGFKKLRLLPRASKDCSIELKGRCFHHISGPRPGKFCCIF